MSGKTVKPRLPRGLIDRLPADVGATDRMLGAIRESYELYGFEAVETPFIEYTDALGKFLPDQDRPNEGVFSFQDDDEQWLSLRYDLTAPLARYVAENFDRLAKPYRSYRCGWVFRNEKPGPGRFRQFMQFDADTVGASSPAADAEICMMAADTLERLGIARGDYVVKVNNRKVLDGVMEAAGVADHQKLAVLRSLDKADKFAREDIGRLLTTGRKDESGDFTKGAGLNEAGATFLLDFLSGTRDFDMTAGAGDVPRGAYEWAAGSPFLEPLRANPRYREGMIELADIGRLSAAAGYGPDRIRIDPSVVRGLEYYTGPVFEAELTFEVTGEDGRPVRFGSVGGGGRYDGLVGRFRGESVPATGFSIGVSRLYAALKAVKSPIVAGAAKAGPVVVLALDRDGESMARTQRLVSTLRGANIPAELYLGDAGMNAQLKYADRRGAVCAVIQGSNEREKGVVAIKDLIAGAELNRAAKTIERDAFLALKQRAQIEAAESDLVARVREVLARHRPGAP